MKTIIIDDDTKAAQYLEEQLKEYPDVEVAGTATNGLDGLRLTSAMQPELLFLDIELPDISGIDFLERLDHYTHGHCRVVMYSAYDKFMLPAFRNRAFDFLVKPFDSSELRTIMHRVYTDRKYAPALPGSATAQDRAQGTALPGTLAQTHASADGRMDDGKFLLYTSTVDFRLVNIRDIGVFQYNPDTRSWEAVLAGVDEPIKLKRTLNSDALVDISPDFVQVHQKFIINMSYLMEVTDNCCHFFPPFDNIDYVRVGRLYRRKLVEKFSTL